MPKTRLDRLSRRDPPIDWLWAAILERKMVRGIDLKHLASIAEVSYDYMRRLIVRPTAEWPSGALGKVCREFGIKLTPVVMGSTPEGVLKEEER